MKEGVIGKVDSGGLAYVRDVQSQEVFVFTFDKIVGYKGETAKEVGIQTGRRVQFETAGEIVQRVVLI